MSGRPEQIAADLRQYIDLGVSNFIVGFPAGDSVASIQENMEQFTREVAPLIPQD
jgi:alkanesulfonate monooxygenase SsuD/methylene tetrahydromethanopterin reductase-like flavin-dependent oxidoreductase (luciferase family)